MERGFLILTGLLAASTFAGVWYVSAPPPAIAGAASHGTLPPPDPEPARAPKLVIRFAPSPRDAHVAAAAPRARRQAVAAPRVEQAAAVYYAGCNQVRALGRAPLYRNQPGYRVDMDGDGDGIACEWHP